MEDERDLGAGDSVVHRSSGGSRRPILERAIGDQSRSEYATPPRAVIVHDPVASGAFARFAEVADTTVERTLLFRETPSTVRYQRQHAAFVAALRLHVPLVHELMDLVPPELQAALRTNPNHVFTRDAVLTFPWEPDRYIAGRMREPLRRREPPVLEAAMIRLGARPVAQVPEEVVLEGGDVIPFDREGRRTLLVGFGPRTSENAIDFLQSLIPLHLDEIIGLELSPWRMNLDGGFLPVADDVALVEPTSFRRGMMLDGRGRHAVDFLGLLRDLGYALIEVGRDDSIHRQACNAVCLGGRKVLYYDLTPGIADELRRRHVEPVLVPGTELVKGRGGPRCMSRPVY